MYKEKEIQEFLGPRISSITQEVVSIIVGMPVSCIPLSSSHTTTGNAASGNFVLLKNRLQGRPYAITLTIRSYESTDTYE